jgi:hypothetical protein
MSDATFRDLCFDATDAVALSEFWAAALGRTTADTGDADQQLIDPPPGAPEATRIWVNAVPEPRIGKTRVHLDIRLPGERPDPFTAPDGTPHRPAALAVLEARGATVLRPVEDGRWWLLTDPEGNEFCAFPRRPDGTGEAGAFELVVDCRDAWRQASWWAARLGGRATRDNDQPWAWVEGAADFPWGVLVFNPVPEGKTVKNRLHWDVNLTTSGPESFVAAGARILRVPGEDRWWVLADPEGNEFCAVPPSR